MKIMKGILIALILLPWLFAGLAILDTYGRLGWILLETFCYFPIYWLNEPFFKETEIGWVVTVTGKALGTTIYVALLAGLVVFQNWQLTSKSTTTR